MQKKLRLKQQIAEQEGNVAIEFALVAPFLLLLIFGILQVGLYIYESSTLEGALNAASREGRTGYAGTDASGVANPVDDGTTGGNRWNLVQGLLNSQAGGLLDTSRITFDATSYAGFQYVGLACPTYPCNGAGQSGQTNNSIGQRTSVVVYNATYPSPMLPFMNAFFGVNPVIQVSDIVQNEPFNGPPQSPPPEASSTPPGPTPTAGPTPVPTPTAVSTPRPTATMAPSPPPASECTLGCCPNC